MFRFYDEYGDPTKLFMVWVVLIAVSVSTLFYVVRSYFEAEAYNRITGANVSTWDAMFLELRVEANSPAPSPLGNSEKP